MANSIIAKTSTTGLWQYAKTSTSCLWQYAKTGTTGLWLSVTIPKWWVTKTPSTLNLRRQAAFWTNWCTIRNCCNGKKEMFANFFSPAALKDGDRQRCIISGRTWHHYSCRDMCALQRLNCALCKFRARVTKLSQTLCTCTHFQGLCTVLSSGVYFLDIALNMQEIMVTYLLMAIWCCC